MFDQKIFLKINTKSFLFLYKIFYQKFLEKIINLTFYTKLKFQKDLLKKLPL